MPDEVTIGARLWEIVVGILVLLFSFVGFNVRQLLTKVNDHDKNHLPREEFNNTIIAMRREIKEDFKNCTDRSREDYKDLVDKIENLPEKLK